MATDLERLVVSLEMSIKKYENQLKKAMSQTNTQANKIERRFVDMNKNIGRSFGAITRVGGGVLSAAGAKVLLDSATRIDNALKVAGLSGDELNNVFNKLYESAQNNGAPLEALADLYGKVALSQKELGVGSLELAKFSDNVAVALRVSGKTAAESSGALMQLSQALGGGVVRAEEFNSMLEGSPAIVQAAANGIEEAGGSVAKLRKLVNDGEVSSKTFFLGFQAGAEGLRTKAASMDMTISGAFTNLKNAAINAAREVDQTSKISSQAVAGINNLSLAVERLVKAYKALAEFAASNDTAKGVVSLGSAAEDLWQNPSWRNLVKFLEPNAEHLLFGPAEDRSIQTRIDGLQKLAAEMRSVEALRQEGLNKLKNAGNTTPNRFDEAFAPFTPKKTSIKDNPVTTKKSDGSGSDPFGRSVAQIEKRIAVLNAETAAVDLGAAAQQRARVQAELETAAKRANEAAGLKNTEVTEAQRAKITELADAYMKAAQNAEAANTPLMQLARSSRDTQAAMQELAVGGLKSLEDGLVDIISGTESVADAFKKMANAIIADLIRIAIRQAIIGPLAGAFGGMFGGGGSLLAGARASGGPVSGGKPYLVGEKGPEIVVPGRSGSVVPNNMISRGGRGGSAPITINLVEDSSRAGQISKRDNGAGGFDLTAFVDSITAKNIGNPGSATRQTLGQAGRLASR